MSAYVVQTAPSARPVTTWSWILATAAIVLAVISAIGMIVTQSEATERTVADAAEAGQIAPLLAVGGAALAMLVVLVGMIITAVLAGRVQSRGGPRVLARSLVVMGGGLVLSAILWIVVVTVWAMGSGAS